MALRLKTNKIKSRKIDVFYSRRLEEIEAPLLLFKIVKDNTMTRAYYSDYIANFRISTSEEIIGKLAICNEFPLGTKSA